MLANSEMQILTEGAAFEVARVRILPCCSVRRSQIRGAAQKPWNILGKLVEHFSGCISTGHTLCVGWKNGKVAIPAGRKLPALHHIDFGCEFRIFSTIGREKLCPLPPRFGAARSDSRREVFANSVGNEKPRVFRPSVAAFCETDFFLSERLAMRCGGVMQMRRAVADVAVEDDECRAAFCLSKNGEAVLNQTDVVGITDSQDIPAVSEKS